MNTTATNSDGPPIKVKFMWRGRMASEQTVIQRQLPSNLSHWGRCQFIFDPDCRDYHWLAVYDDLTPLPGDRFSSRIEPLPCPTEHTLFITVEPSSIKTYGYDFLDQFGVIVTSQEPWAITNKQALFTQPALRWFYGFSRQKWRNYDDLVNNPPLNKTADLSTVCSTKQHRQTRHADRYHFTQRLKQLLPELELFGRGIRDIVDKADALDSFRYHVAVENHFCRHHWTEKLSDAFLGATLPFYWGCPNVVDYFPADSLIPIDIADPEGTAATIRWAIATHQYERRLAAILEARRLVLEKYNLFAVIAREVEDRFDPNASPQEGACIYSRHRSRRRTPLHIVRFGMEHVRTRMLNRHNRYHRAA